ncbi:glutamine--tRNA ligase/YqeY domain fusion protein [Deinococcus piscis]|nr:glutamine--tRNA ligase/YqeY domain fusion protein [Deinococcus piscis]
MTGPDSVPTAAADAPRVAPNFITEIIERDLESGKYPQVVTRFPPEPSGYAHLGHVFASFLDFQTAVQYGGRYHLRMDDTNPELATQEYVDAIADDLRWLGWDWGEHFYYASDNFERYYEYAEQLIRQGDAYVDSVSGDEMAALRGTPDQPGTPSPYRERTPEENLDLFRRMRAGEFGNGEHVLRAKIDLSSPNMKLRDPALYRILHVSHYRAGDWCIYPMYDFQHPLQDALEGVTHSMCSLEFVDNRAIYDWLMERLGFEPRPHQYEFGRRGLEYTITSKRKLRRLIEEGLVSGWDDPRMPTLRAQRRLGVTPEAVRAFAAQIGVNRTNRTVDLAVYENAVRGDLNTRAPRVMAVLEPLKVELTNLTEPQELTLPYWPHDVVALSPDGLLSLPGGERVPADQAVRGVPLTREVYIEQSDFALSPPKGFKRLTQGGMVRLRGAGIIRADEVELDDAGQPVLIRASIQPEEVGAAGVIHWVSAGQSVPAEFRLYDRLFRVPNPEGENPQDASSPLETPEFDPEGMSHEGDAPVSSDFVRFLNPDSLRVLHGFVEPSVLDDPQDTRYQFERQGYFWRDPVDSREEGLVFGRIITLRDSWAKSLPRAEKVSGAGRPAVADANGKKATAQAPAEAKAPDFTPQEQAEMERLRGLGVGEEDAIALARDPQLGEFFAQGGAGAHAAQVAAWVVNDLSGVLRSGTNRLSAADLPALAELLAQGSISSRIAKDVLARSAQSGEAPAAAVEREGLKVMSDAGELRRIVDEVLAAHPAEAEAFRGGKRALQGFFMGQVMKATGGQADAGAVGSLLKEVAGG